MYPVAFPPTTHPTHPPDQFPRLSLNMKIFTFHKTVTFSGKTYTVFQKFCAEHFVVIQKSPWYVFFRRVRITNIKNDRKTAKIRQNAAKSPFFTSERGVLFLGFTLLKNDEFFFPKMRKIAKNGENLGWPQILSPISIFQIVNGANYSPLTRDIL